MGGHHLFDESDEEVVNTFHEEVGGGFEHERFVGVGEIGHERLYERYE